MSEFAHAARAPSRYNSRMHLIPRVPCLVALALLACNNSTGSTGAASATDTSTTADTTGTPGTSMGPGDPTTGPGTTASTSIEPTTSPTDTETTSTTGEPDIQCSQYRKESDCELAGCEWTQVLAYTHNTQGCQGSFRDFCVPKNTSGAPTAVWKDENGDIDVLQFGHNPTDLGPEWQTCDCDGPLACLCTTTGLDCPDRLEAFCSTITGEGNCKNALASGSLVCSWFIVSKEGPLDGACDDPPWSGVCLPATKIGSNTCDPISLPYVDEGYCFGWTDPVFWREVDGIVEVTTKCGPEPIGWNLCTADNPDQPGECKCGCKV